jgi:DNA-directed RNA polymerase specialized sigma24 family protein
MNGYKIGEISDITGIPQGTVKNRLFQAREILKRRLTENEKDYR